jgi:gluconate:H+ symporter, GntP family
MGTWPLVAAAIAVVLLLFLISYWKIHAFFALLFSTLILGLMSGMSPHSIVTSFQKGIADLLGSIAIIIAAGAVMGRLIQITGAGEVIAQKLIRLLGNKRIPLAVFLFAYLIGIPVFFDVAFITFIPLIWNLGRIEKKSLLLFVLPFVAALMTTTGLVPTNPGPAAAAQLLGADLGKTMLCGLALGVPMAIVGGILYGGWISKRIFVEPLDSLVAVTQTDNEPLSRRPSFLSVVLVILLPVTLMGGAVLVPLLFSSDSKIVVWARFVGNPSIALLCATAFAYLVLGVRLGLHPAELMRHTGAALNSVGSLILIVGASGAFKQVVLDSGAGSTFVALILNTGLSPLLMAYLVAAALRMTLGSATGAIATAAGLVAPIALAFPNLNRVLIVMAVATGGSIFSYVNDAGFWMVKEFCGMTVTQTLKSYSTMKLITSLTGLLLILILSHFL